jgi:hypothetical protein
MGDDQRFCYSARDIRKALRESSPEDAPRGLIEGFKALVASDKTARARLAGNHPKRRRLLDRAEDLPFTVHQDLMRLGPEGALMPYARDVLCHEWHLEPPDRRSMASQAEAALLLVRFLALLVLTASRTHPFMVLLVLSQLLEAKQTPQNSATWPAPQNRPARVVKPPGQTVLAEPRLARAPNLPRPSSPCAARTVPGCVRLGGAL